MGVMWTTEQQKVIDSRDCNILVSAAAGSGKTAVLVERIISMVTDPVHPVDIDRLLIVTFTRAAAGEMRERIRLAIEKSLRRMRTMSICRGRAHCFTTRRSPPLTASVPMW